jgi:hypothetical protein
MKHYHCDNPLCDYMTECEEDLINIMFLRDSYKCYAQCELCEDCAENVRLLLMSGFEKCVK